MSYLESLIAKTASMVARWQGHPARMLELTRSHPTLTIVLGDETYGRNLLISCLEPTYICGPARWETCHIILKTTALDQGEEIVLTDERNGVRIVAGSFEVRENVKW